MPGLLFYLYIRLASLNSATNTGSGSVWSTYAKCEFYKGSFSCLYFGLLVCFCLTWCMFLSIHHSLSWSVGPGMSVSGWLCVCPGLSHSGFPDLYFWVWYDLSVSFLPKLSLSVYLGFIFSICCFVLICIGQSICFSMFICLSLSFLVCLSTLVCLCLSVLVHMFCFFCLRLFFVCVSLCMSILSVLVCLSLLLFFWSLFLGLCLPIWLSVWVGLSLSVFVCLSARLFGLFGLGFSMYVCHGMCFCLPTFLCLSCAVLVCFHVSFLACLSLLKCSIDLSAVGGCQCCCWCAVKAECAWKGEM